MPSTSSTSDNKSRQSSSSKSFFTRRILRDKSNTDQDVPEIPSQPSSTTGSQSSRHSHQTSFTSSERPLSHGTDAAGLAMQAGVLTSIPYDSTSSNTKLPTNYGSLPRPETAASAREPSPHHLNKATNDFHQYPNIDPTSLASNESRLNGPRPLNGASTGSRASDRTLFSDRWYGPNGSLKTPVASEPEDTRSQRRSFDQQSTWSNTSPSRDSGVLSHANNSQSSFPASTSDHYPTSPQHSVRPSISTMQSYQTSSHASGLTFNPIEFSLNKPPDDKLVEEAFLNLMLKRGYQGLPEQARRQMEAYPIAKKWTLVHQDRLSEQQNEQQRRARSRNTVGYEGQSGLLGRSDEEGSPEWYVRKLMDSTIDLKQLQSLAVSLRTQPIMWVRTFLGAQGQIALSNVLNKLNRRQGDRPTQQKDREKDSDREYEIVKCLKALMNNQYGADDALEHPQIIVALAASLTSSRLGTRKLVSEVLTFLCHWMEGMGHLKVLQAFDQLKGVQGEHGRFDGWMRIVEVSIDGRGKMGSLVGASDEYRSGGAGMENMLMEYAVASLLLVNMLVDTPDRDLQMRCHIRAQLNACGIQRILTKMEGFQYEVIDKQIERFRTNEAIDYEDMLERGSSRGAEDEPERDLNDPTQIVEAIATRTQGSKAYDYFLSSMQHMLLIRDNEGEDRLRMFQLVDSMLSYVAMDRRLPDMDLKQSLNFSVQGLLDKLYTDSEARQAREEALQSKQIADAAIAERDDMRSQVELGAGGLVAKLQKQLEEQQALINLQNRKLDNIKSDLAESQRLRAQELQRNELETRELYLMMRDAQEATAAAIKASNPNGIVKDQVQMQGILDREKLMDRLQMQLERAKTQAKLEGRVWEQVNPSDKLRELREQMEEGGPEEIEGKDERLSRQFGSVTRKSIRKQVVEAEDSEDAGDETIVFEKPRIIEYSKPKVDKAAAQNYLNDIVSKVRRYDASDDEEDDVDVDADADADADGDGDGDGDGTTTGPSHPSIESDEPKTPEEPAVPSTIISSKDFSGPPPPAPPPMPDLADGAPPPPPPPPLPPMASGFSNAAPPPPPPPLPPMPGFSSNGIVPPPPPPPMPMSVGVASPTTPVGLGFTGGPPPPPPPGFAFSPTGVPGSPLIPGAPPLPGGGGMYRPRRPESYQEAPKLGLASVRPKKKLKAIHWEKVDTPQVTVWANHAPTHEAKEEKYLELSRNGILDEVERLFKAKEIKQIGKAVRQADDKKLIISSDLQKTFHIALSKFHHHEIDQIVRMIIHCDNDILENDNVMDFLQRGDLCDIPENTAKLMAPYGRDFTMSNPPPPDQDPTELTRADQIYLHTAFELHHYWKPRMRALALTRSFTKEYDEISAKVSQVVAVCQSLRDTVALFNVLGLILDIGNFMNDQSKQASGFKLSTLARLGMVKDDKGESTFADIIERIVRQQYPQWETFVDDIAGVVPAQKINVDQLRTDAQKYVQNITNVQRSLDSGSLSDPKKFHPEDRVSQVVQRSMKDARWKAEQMSVYLDDMSKTYDDILSFFGEDPADENSRRDFFHKIAIFLLDWKRSKEKNLVVEEQHRRNEESMRRKGGGPNANLPAGSAKPSSPTAFEAGAMDSLLEKLRAAAPQAKDQRDRRRRARLRDKHQIRVASGQAMPDLPADGVDSPTTATDGSTTASTNNRSIDGMLLNAQTGVGSDVESSAAASAGEGRDLSAADDDIANTEEGEDIADRAASMLQGLGLNSSGSDPPISVRRRRDRDSLIEDRDRRRRRNRNTGSGLGGGIESLGFAGAGPGMVSPVLEQREKEETAAEDGSNPGHERVKTQAGEEEQADEDEDGGPIRMVVSPPSPRGPSG